MEEAGTAAPVCTEVRARCGKVWGHEWKGETGRERGREEEMGEVGSAARGRRGVAPRHGDARRHAHAPFRGGRDAAAPLTLWIAGAGLCRARRSTGSDGPILLGRFGGRWALLADSTAAENTARGGVRGRVAAVASSICFEPESSVGFSFLAFGACFCFCTTIESNLSASATKWPVPHLKRAKK